MTQEPPRYVSKATSIIHTTRTHLSGLVLFLSEYIQLFALIFGLVFTLGTAGAIIILGRVQMAVILATASIGFFSYFLLGDPLDENVYAYEVNLKYVHLFYCIIYVSTVLVLLREGMPLFRPPLFFVLLTLLFVSPALEVHLREKIRSLAVLSILSKIILAQLLYKWSMFNGIHSTGGDATNHIRNAMALVDFGHISTMPGYSLMPFLHILWSELAMVLGINIFDARTGIFFVSSLGVLFIYIVTRTLIGPRPSLYAAVIFGTFTLTNRVKIQSEAIAFPVFIMISLYLLYRANIDRRSVAIFQIFYISLILTHFYYANLLLQYVAVVVFLLLVFKPLVSPKVVRYSTYLLTFAAAVWASRILFSQYFQFTVISVSEIFIGLFSRTGSLSVQPSFLTPKITNWQFITLHISEFVVISLTVIALIWFVDQYSPSSNLATRRLLFAGAFVFFSIGTVVFIIVEGQRRLAWGVSFRSVYLIGIFLCIFAGCALDLLSKSSPGRKSSLAAIFLIMLVVSGGATASQQTNRIDPLVYAGEVQSPFVFTMGQFNTLSEFYEYVPDNSTILGGQLLTREEKISAIRRDSNRDISIKNKFFLEPSLQQLNEEYDYLMLNSYTRDRGMLYKGATSGLEHDREFLESELSTKNKIWETGQVSIYSDHH